MQYKWWITALYDEYEKRKKEQQKNEHKKITLKEFMKKENRAVHIFMICVFIISILFITGLINEMYYWILLLLTEIVIILPESYRNSKKLNLNIFKEDVQILKDIMIEEGIYDISIINKLLENTGGFLYKIENDKMNYLKYIIILLSSIPITFGAKIKVSLDLEIYLVIAFILLLILGTIIWISYIIKSLSFTDGYKKEQLHEKLKILLMYKIAEDNKKTSLRLINNINKKKY